MSIFKEGDKVFDFNYGWGKVVDSDYSENYTLLVKFPKKTELYTKKGCVLEQNKTPVLSFTEYDLVNGGFSQKRPEPEIEPGTPCFVRDHEDGVWLAAKYVDYQKYGEYSHLVKTREHNSPELFKHVRLDHPFKKDQ